MKSRDAFFLGAIGAAIETPARFDAVADDLTAAMFAFRRHFMDGAFEAVEVMGNAVHHNFERLIILVTAYFAFVHNLFSVSAPTGRICQLIAAEYYCRELTENSVWALTVS